MSVPAPTNSEVTQKRIIRIAWLALSIFSSAPIALLYGIFTRLVFGKIPGMELPAVLTEPLSTLSYAFLFLVPLAMGALTVAFAPPEWRTSLIYAIIVPLLNCTIWVIIVMVLTLEIFVCLAMALPLVIPVSVVGGVIMCIIFKVWRNTRKPVSAVAIFVILPYLIAPIESQFPVQDSFHTVETVTIIHADPATVWRNIIRVPQIQPEERDFRLYRFFNLPWPMEAMLDQDGLGGVRFAQYDNGMTFNEPITDWQVNETFSFDIDINDHMNLPMPYNEIGGPMFDTISGTFIIEPMDDGNVRLRLISQHRLTTRFNAYGGLWTEWLMADLQNHILHVIKLRAEAGK
jgi:hypothetical protein